MKILVTGATGFIGKELLKHLNFAEVTAISRDKQAEHKNIMWKHIALERLLVSDKLNGEFDVVIHLAGRAHMLADNHDDPLSEFRKVNKDISVELAKQLATNGLKRFIFVSSIGVNGASSENQPPFNEESEPNPHSDYAISKYEAEIALAELAKELNFELVVIRPPLVYGKNAPGNFGKLVRIIKNNLPLPFASVNNSRSYISVTNLASFLALCASHPKAANEVFLISDGEPLSTPALLKKMIFALKAKSILFPSPKLLMHALFVMIGKKNMSIQLLDSLEVDCSKAQSLLNWAPVESMDEALQKIKN